MELFCTRLFCVRILGVDILEGGKMRLFICENPLLGSLDDGVNAIGNVSFRKVYLDIWLNAKFSKLLLGIVDGGSRKSDNPPIG